MRFVAHLTSSRKQFDRDVKDLVQIKVVHGSWKKEDLNRLYIEVY